MRSGSAFSAAELGIVVSEATPSPTTSAKRKYHRRMIGPSLSKKASHPTVEEPAAHARETLFALRARTLYCGRVITNRVSRVRLVNACEQRSVGGKKPLCYQFPRAVSARKQPLTSIRRQYPPDGLPVPKKTTACLSNVVFSPLKRQAVLNDRRLKQATLRSPCPRGTIVWAGRWSSTFPGVGRYPTGGKSWRPRRRACTVRWPAPCPAGQSVRAHTPV